MIVEGATSLWNLLRRPVAVVGGAAVALGLTALVVFARR